MVFKATFNNISVISWQSVLLVGEAGESSDQPQVTDKLYRISTYRQRHLHLNSDIQVYILLRVKIMMLNTTFNMISALS